MTSYEEFWRHYEDALPAHRHFYEIIQEGWPCHLYFGEPCRAQIARTSQRKGTSEPEMEEEVGRGGGVFVNIS